MDGSVGIGLIYRCVLNVENGSRDMNKDRGAKRIGGVEL